MTQNAIRMLVMVFDHGSATAAPIAQASAKISSVDYSSDLAHMERRIQEKEVRAAAEDEMKSDSVDEKFRKLGSDSAVDDQLAALKKKMGK